MNLVVAVDGPAGSGKSTISKMIAEELDLTYLDTGAMYRTITLKMMKLGLNLNDEEKIVKVLDRTKISIENGEFYLDGKNVNEEIRTREVSNNVSKIATIREVRENLVEKQRQISQGKRVILDGRDIGTVVFPDATVKIFLNASANKRAKRRMKDYEQKGIEVDYVTILEEILKRDSIDENRENSPLKKAYDAVEVDTTFLNIEQVVEKIKKIINKKIIDKML